MKRLLLSFRGRVRGICCFFLICCSAALLMASHDPTAYVPSSRTVNGHALSGNVTVLGSDITSIPNSSLSNSSVTIAGHAVSLGGSQTLSSSDVGLGNVINAIAPIVQAGKTSAITTTNIVSSVAADSLYQVKLAINCKSTSAAATVQATISYTDLSGTVQSVSPAAVATCTTLGVGSITSLQVPIMAKAGTAITYSTAIVNTPTYDVRIALEPLTSN